MGPSEILKYRHYRIERWDGVGSGGRDLFYAYPPNRTVMVESSASLQRLHDWIDGAVAGEHWHPYVNGKTWGGEIEVA